MEQNEQIDLNRLVNLLGVTCYESMSKDELEEEKNSMQKLLEKIELECPNADGIESYKEDLIYIKNLLKNI